MKWIQVRLMEEEVRELRHKAVDAGMSSSGLVREWILEKLTMRKVPEGERVFRQVTSSVKQQNVETNKEMVAKVAVGNSLLANVPVQGKAGRGEKGFH
jgi:hypothetical protein